MIITKDYVIQDQGLSGEHDYSISTDDFLDLMKQGCITLTNLTNDFSFCNKIVNQYEIETIFKNLLNLYFLKEEAICVEKVFNSGDAT